MSETCQVVFQYALGQQVCVDGDPHPWRIVRRLYEERADLGPVVTYLLTRPGQADRAYEPDLRPHEEFSHERMSMSRQRLVPSVSRAG